MTVSFMRQMPVAARIGGLCGLCGFSRWCVVDEGLSSIVSNTGSGSTLITNAREVSVSDQKEIYVEEITEVRSKVRNWRPSEETRRQPPTR